jgi:hypothetical protein
MTQETRHDGADIINRAARYADLLKEHEVAVEAGSTTKTWKTAGDGHVRDSHAEMEGVTVGTDEEFEVGGQRLFLPSDPSAVLEETANCRCYVAYGVGEGHPGADFAGDGPVRVAVSAYGEGRDTIIVYSDGSDSVRRSGTRAWRNNNPGNLRNFAFSIRHGSLGDAGGFAVFPSEAAGWEALLSLLRGATYQAMTVREAIENYAPPNENDTAAYSTFVVGKLSLAAVTRMSELTSAQIEDLAACIRQYEGWREGRIEPRDADRGGHLCVARGWFLVRRA